MFTLWLLYSVTLRARRPNTAQCSPVARHGWRRSPRSSRCTVTSSCVTARSSDALHYSVHTSPAHTDTLIVRHFVADVKIWYTTMIARWWQRRKLIYQEYKVFWNTNNEGKVKSLILLLLLFLCCYVTVCSYKLLYRLKFKFITH